MLDFVVLSKIEFKSTEYIQEEKIFLEFRTALHFTETTARGPIIT